MRAAFAFAGVPGRDKTAVAALDVAVGHCIVVHATALPGPTSFAQEDATKRKTASTEAFASADACERLLSLDHKGVTDTSSTAETTDTQAEGGYDLTIAATASRRTPTAMGRARRSHRPHHHQPGADDP